MVAKINYAVARRGGALCFKAFWLCRSVQLGKQHLQSMLLHFHYFQETFLQLPCIHVGKYISLGLWLF